MPNLMRLLTCCERNLRIFLSSSLREGFLWRSSKIVLTFLDDYEFLKIKVFQFFIKLKSDSIFYKFIFKKKSIFPLKLSFSIFPLSVAFIFIYKIFSSLNLLHLQLQNVFDDA